MNETVKNQLLTKVVDKENHKTYYERDFETTKCNEKWSTDVSEFRIAAGKLYLSRIIDLNNREIISYSISKSTNFEQTNEMFYGNEYVFKTLGELKIAMEEYIEYYNTQRITVKLKGLTPVQYRNQSLLIV